MRKKRKFLTPLALEALAEKLSKKTTCLLTHGKRNHKTTKFETYAEMLNILLNVSQLDCNFLMRNKRDMCIVSQDKDDSIDHLPIAKRLVYVMLRQSEAKFPDVTHSLAIPLGSSLYTSVIESKNNKENQDESSFIKPICKD